MADDNLNGGSSSLFQGKQFWLSQNVPQRSRFKELITQHGGHIRPLEKNADIKLVDHKRKDLPPDVYSYKYVEESIRQKKLVDLESHKVGLSGPSQQRPVGATYIPTKSIRAPYTLEEDQLIWDWMQPFEETPGAPIHGNKIYQDLAAAYPSHTFQSYRDRYLKRLRGQPRPGGMARPAQASSSIPHRTQAEPGGSHQRSPEFNIGSPPARYDPTRNVARVPTSSATATAEQRAERAQSTSPSRANAANERQRDRAFAPAPSTPVAWLQKTTEPATNKTDNRKRKRSLDTGYAPETTEPQTQKKRRPSQPTTHEIRSPEPIHRHTPPRTSAQPSTNSTQTTNPGNQQNTSQSNDNLLLELPFFPSDLSDSEPDPEPEQDLDDWIDSCVATGKARTVKQVIEALRCASMDPSVADKVLPLLVDGKGIPGDMPGVWTVEDDAALEGTDARNMERVMKKHGMGFVNARWEYLGLARSAGLIEH